MNAILGNQPVTMSSREIADVTGKRHPDVKRDIERMLVDLEEDVSRFAHIYIDSMNREQTEYRLDRELTETLLLGYSAPLRRKVIKRLRELEAMVASPRPLITTETLIQMLTLQAEVERRQAEQAKAITAIDARVERVETAQTVLSARPANSESIVHIRRRIWRLYGLSDATVDAVMRQSPYAPKPAGMVRNEHAEADGAAYAVYWKKDVTATFERFVAECRHSAGKLYTHPYIEGRFKLIKHE
ncbi:Rha family transcriptional regulator [Sinorhizobium medicae]|uniref:Rha family transcriptional regulator n=1 Tax=Sinorhizobium medicae TaxID=110321 RepID=UPI001AAC5421|nr:Rha family transcriptional regulator [Sinorhizobium medicae]MBO1943150.1 Rha family transcriptional regulator [Sinorhizobium medicae]